MSYPGFITGTETAGEAWLLPHGALTDTVCVQVVRDACGVAVTLSVDLPAGTDASTPSAALTVLAGALSALAAEMKAGAA